jgi:hypothetical protein
MTQILTDALTVHAWVARGARTMASIAGIHAEEA